MLKPAKNGQEASDSELAAYLIVANRYRLDPLTRQIHAFWDANRGIVPIVGIDGWAAIVNREPQFDGVDFEERCDADGRIVSVRCTIYRRDLHHPISITEYLRECYRNTPPWNQMPARMLRHKAFIQAARLAFSISGIYDEDEARDIVTEAPRESTIEQSAEIEPKTKRIAEKLKKQLEPPPTQAEPPPETKEEPQQDDKQQPQLEPPKDLQTVELSAIGSLPAGSQGIVRGIVDSVEMKERFSRLILWHGAHSMAFTVFDHSADNLGPGQLVQAEFSIKDRAGKTYRNAANIIPVEFIDETQATA